MNSLPALKSMVSSSFLSKMIQKRQTGVSLVEVVLVLGIIIFLALLISSLPSSIATINKSRHISIAKDIAGKQIDKLRKDGFLNLPTGSNTFSDSSLSSLPQSTATYEVIYCPVEVCGINDEEKKPKEVKVTVSWNEIGDAKSVELTTIISQGGLVQ